MDEDRLCVWRELTSLLPQPRATQIMHAFIAKDPAGTGCLPLSWLPEVASAIHWEGPQESWLAHGGRDQVAPAGYITNEAVLLAEIYGQQGPMAQHFHPPGWAEAGRWFYDSLVITSCGPGLICSRLTKDARAALSMSSWSCYLVALLPDVVWLSLRGIPQPELGNEVLCLPHLQMLRLESCELTTLPAAVAWLPQLAYLSVRDNLLTSLPEDLNHAFSLRVLCLCRNLLSILPPLGGSRIETLRADHNPLAAKDGHNGFVPPHTLMDLTINRASLPVIPIECRLLRLRRLALAGNFIAHIPPLLPTATPELVHLDLEHNRIRSLPTSSMQWTMLEVLLLEGNIVEVIFAEDEDGPTRWPRLRSFTGLFVTVTVI